MLPKTAFTLIEIILVLAILILIAMLGIPALRGTLAQQELRSAADRIRGEWLATRVIAMEEGQILCMRAKIGGSTLVIERVLDTHFTAGLSTRQTTRRFEVLNESDPWERGGFAGEGQDFIVSDPENRIPGKQTTVIELPRSVLIADVIALPDERAAFYLGFTDDEHIVDEVYQLDAFLTGEVRLGETSSSDGLIWSTPIFFYPDGSTSTSAVLLKNESGRCIEVRLRGLTGSALSTGIVVLSDYIGDLDASR